MSFHCLLQGYLNFSLSERTDEFQDTVHDFVLWDFREKDGNVNQHTWFHTERFMSRIQVIRFVRYGE
jgi:hypothetical protein